jgi:hypothetical protein
MCRLIVLKTFQLIIGTGMSEAEMKEEAKSLQNQAVLKFSQRNYKKAIELFTAALELLQGLHGPSSPECDKIKKSIEACTKKMST